MCKGLSSLMILVAWEVWKHRNDSVFENLSPSTQAVLRSVSMEQHMGGEVAGLRRGSMARPVSVQASTPLPARSRDVRVLHEVLPSLRSARPVPSSVADGGPDARKEEVAAPDCTEEGFPEAKHCTSVEVKKGMSLKIRLLE